MPLTLTVNITLHLADAFIQSDLQEVELLTEGQCNVL